MCSPCSPGLTCGPAMLANNHWASFSASRASTAAMWALAPEGPSAPAGQHSSAKTALTAHRALPAGQHERVSATEHQNPLGPQKIHLVQRSVHYTPLISGVLTSRAGRVPPGNSKVCCGAPDSVTNSFGAHTPVCASSVKCSITTAAAMQLPVPLTSSSESSSEKSGSCWALSRLPRLQKQADSRALAACSLCVPCSQMVSTQESSL